jgi:tetrapyrrole methylase family protein/MazG family protein
MANKKFMTRFRKMEELAEKPLTEYSFEEYDELWKRAKKELSVDEKRR